MLRKVTRNVHKSDNFVKRDGHCTYHNSPYSTCTGNTEPTWQSLTLRGHEEVAKKEEIYRSNQKRNFDCRHQLQELPDLTNSESVLIRDQDILGKVQGRTEHPRSFLNETEKDTVRRNRPVIAGNQAILTSSVSDQPVDDSGMTFSRFISVSLCYLGSLPKAACLQRISTYTNMFPKDIQIS